MTVIGQSGSFVADGGGRVVVEPDPDPPFVLLVARPDGVALKPVTVVELPGDEPFDITVGAMGETVTVISGVVPDLELPPAVARSPLGDCERLIAYVGSVDDRLDFGILEKLAGAGLLGQSDAKSGEGHRAGAAGAWR